MLNISAFRIEIIPDPVIEIDHIVKTEVEDDVSEVRGKGYQPMMTPDSVGDRQSGYEEVGDRGEASQGKKRGRAVEVEVGSRRVHHVHQEKSRSMKMRILMSWRIVVVRGLNMTNLLILK
jgi:hypothetical protein